MSRSLLHRLWLGAFGLGLAACASGPALPAAPPPQSAAQLERWRTPPALQPEPELELQGEVQRATLDNGLHVSVVARPESPSTMVRLWVPSLADEGEGPLVFVAEALRAGTEVKGGLLVNPRLGESPIGIYTGPMGTEFVWQVLPRASEHAVALLGRFVLYPAFEPAELRIRQQRELAIIESYASSSARVADVARGALPLLEEPSPDQDAKRLLELSAEQVRHLYRCSMRPEGAELVIVGPVSSEAALGWARRAFDTWKVGARAGETGCARPAPPRTDDAALKEPLVQPIGGALGEPYMVMALPGPARSSADFAAFVLLSEMLKLRDQGSTQALRHAGSTYAIEIEVNSSYPGFSLLELRGLLEKSAAARALRALILDIRGLEQRLGQAELDIAKRRAIAGYAYTMRSDSALAASVTWELQRGHPPEDAYAWPRTLRAVDLEHCRQVARRWLSEAQPSIAVSSAPSKLTESLGFPVTVRHRQWQWQDPNE